MIAKGLRNSHPAKIRVKRKGFRQDYFSDIYHFVLAISWFEFFIINTTLYIFMNMFFALLYYVGGDSIINADPQSYWDAFVFSFQTSSTIGYGHLRPANSYADAIVILDTLSGIIYVAITTGLAFAKFSRPTAKVIFTKNCVIHKYQGKKTLMFRVANARDSHIADASIDAVAVIGEVSPEGLSMQRLHDLPLLRNKTPMFFISWTVMHVIDEQSPFFNKTKKEIEDNDVRIVISLKGIDDWTSQSVHTNYVYQAQDFIFDKKFADILERQPGDVTIMDYNKFNILEDLN